MNQTDARVEEIAKRQHGMIARRQLAELSISPHQIRRRVRSRQWVRELPGVWRMSWAEPTWMQRVCCASLWASPAACVSHRTAARLWDLDGVKPDKIEMTGAMQQRHHGNWLLFHRSAPVPKQMQRIRNGVRLTSPARTLVDLAGVCEEDVVERAMEHAFRRRISSVNEVQQMLRRMRAQGKAGTRSVQRLLERGGFGPETHSELERQARRIFRRFRLPEPVQQYEVVADDLVLGFVDFAWPEAKVIVEAEGFEFHSGRQAWENDIDRYNAIALRDWKLLRLTYADLRDPTHALVKSLKAILRQRRTG